MSTLERYLVISLGSLYAGGILAALLMTRQVATYLPHAAALVVCAAALYAMVHDRRA